MARDFIIQNNEFSGKGFIVLHSFFHGQHVMGNDEWKQELIYFCDEDQGDI
jgi:hypothetical protein